MSDVPHQNPEPAFDLHTWCEGVPGIIRTGKNSWAIAGEARSAFSALAHARLAEIEPKSFWFNHRNRIIASVVRHYPPAGPIFDIGGGNGYVSLGLRNAGFDCVVVEPGTTGASNASERGLPVVCAPFQNLQIGDGTLPNVGMFDVLEHIEDDIAALENLYRVLRRGGRVYIAVPAYQLLWSTDDVEAGHFRRYTVARLSRRMRTAGFSIEYGTYFFSILVPAILFARTLRRGRNAAKADIDIARDHEMPKGAAGALISVVLKGEYSRIARGRSVAFGSSCLVVGRKS